MSQLERLSKGITPSNPNMINWKHSRAEVVEGVELVFSALTEQDRREAKTVEQIFGLFKKVAALAGGVYKWPIMAGAAAIYAELRALGAGYEGAAKAIKEDRAPVGFGQGVVMGVMAVDIPFIQDNMWQWSPSPNPMFEKGGQIAQHYYNASLVLGYDYGRELRGPNGQVFFNDLKRVDTPSLVTHGDPQTPRQWRDFYIDLGAAFVRLHIN
jgi:hypothetical protein